MFPKMNRILAIACPILMMLASPCTFAAPTAKENYDWYCAQCHGLEGKGNGVNSVKELPVGPMDFSVSKEIKKYSNEQIIQTLSHGGPVNTLDSLMPPWGNRLSKDEIEELMKYVRTLCQGDDCPPR